MLLDWFLVKSSVVSYLKDVTTMHHSIQAGMSLILDGRSCILPHDLSMSYISTRSDFNVYSRGIKNENIDSSPFFIIRFYSLFLALRNGE